jgi:hypothetical protein
MATPAVSISMDKWRVHKIIFDTMIWWMLFTYLVLFTLLKIADIVNSRGRNLFERYDIGQANPMHSHAHIPRDHKHPIRIRRAQEVFLGKTIWEAQFQ